MSKLDAQTWLADHGDYLFRVARRQLYSDELAEDAVQEMPRLFREEATGDNGAAGLGPDALQRIATELQNKLDA